MLDIPTEIERLCVEIFISDFVLEYPIFPRELPPVVLVCQRFKDWCYPYLYRSITVHHSFQTKTRFLANLSILRQTFVESPRLALLVQEFIVPALYLEDLVKILPLCLNLVSLLAWDEELSASDLSLSNNRGLRRLSCHPMIFSQLTRGAPLPQFLLQLTHLQLLSPPEDSWYSVIARLENLTHFFTELPDPDDTPLEPLVSHLPPNLRVCILCAWIRVDDPARVKEIASGQVDQRIVLLSDMHVDLEVPHIFLRHSNISIDWGRYWAGESYWNKAELIIRNRTTGNAVQ